PCSTHRSWTQPASRQASSSTTAGRCRPISRVSSRRPVGSVWNSRSPAERYTQATLLYLPRSMARIGRAVAISVVVVFIVQAPWGDGNGVVWQLPRYHTPTACMDSFDGTIMSSNHEGAARSTPEGFHRGTTITENRPRTWSLVRCGAPDERLAHPSPCAAGEG